MHPSTVADASGLLVLTGLLEGTVHDVGEILALDVTSLTLAEYLALRHEGAPERVRVDYALVTAGVAEWFPVRALAVDVATSAVSAGELLDAYAPLALAESLRVPLVTKHRGLTSGEVPVLRC